MDVATDMMKYVIRYVVEHAPEEMAFFNQFVDKGLLDRLEHVATSDFGRVSYTDAVKLLEKAGRSFEYPVFWGMDMQTEHERYLTEEVFKRPDVYKRQGPGHPARRFPAKDTLPRKILKQQRLLIRRLQGPGQLPSPGLLGHHPRPCHCLLYTSRCV